MPEDNFQEVVETLRGLGAERILVLEGPKPFRVRAAFGITDGKPWQDQVSLGLLEHTMGDGSPLLLGDAQSSPFAERWSLLLNSVRSVMCVPFWTPSSRIAGILYADTISKAGVFSRKAVEAVQICARNLETHLYGGPPLKAAAKTAVVAPAGALRLKPAATPVPTTGAREGSGPAPRGKPSHQSVTLFYRSMATLVAAAVPLHRALEICARQEAATPMGAVLRQVSAKVQTGGYLSAALAAHPHLFQSFYVQMVRVAERSGRLHSVLERMADHREQSQRAELKLRKSLMYPAFVVVLCGLSVVLAPPFLLKGQLAMLQSSGQPLPWPTLALVAFSKLATHPLFFVAAVPALWCLRSQITARRLYAWADRFGPSRKLLQHLSTARFASTLALNYRVGLPIQEGLQLAAQASDDPLLIADAPKILEALQQGEPLSVCLSRCRRFPVMLLQMMQAGEEAGKLDELLAWVARFYQLELETTIERLLVLLEPILLMVIGIFVTAILIASLLPMVNLLHGL